MEVRNYQKESLSETFTDKKKGRKLKKFSLIFGTLAVIAMIVLTVTFLPASKGKEEIIKRKLIENGLKWAPAGDKIKTRWAYTIDPENVWPEYPRPQLERKDWLNLNGLWQYSVGNINDESPGAYEGYILVPFPIESSLSGVMKTFTKDNSLWYYREVEIPNTWNGKHILLNFGAVDWRCEVYINNQKVGEHTGGYTHFYFDITSYLQSGKNQFLIKVVDVSDTVYSNWGKYQPVGKQSITPNGIWYTPSSGIWQTVWLEPVSEQYFEKLEINNDYYNKQVKVTFKVPNNAKLPVDFTLKFNNQVVGQTRGTSNEEISITLSNDNFKPW